RADGMGIDARDGGLRQGRADVDEGMLYVDHQASAGSECGVADCVAIEGDERAEVEDVRGDAVTPLQDLTSCQTNLGRRSETDERDVLALRQGLRLTESETGRAPARHWTCLVVRCLQQQQRAVELADGVQDGPGI